MKMINLRAKKTKSDMETSVDHAITNYCSLVWVDGDLKGAIGEILINNANGSSFRLL